METSKRRRSASLWNWFDRLRWNHHHHQQQQHHQQRRQIIKDCNKIMKDYSPSRRRQSTPDEVFLVSCLTLNESPIKRRLSSKRIKRPVSCHTLTSSVSDELKKNRSYYETHFPSETTLTSHSAKADTIDRKVRLNRSHFFLSHLF